MKVSLLILSIVCWAFCITSIILAIVFSMNGGSVSSITSISLCSPSFLITGLIFFQDYLREK